MNQIARQPLIGNFRVKSENGMSENGCPNFKRRKREGVSQLSLCHVHHVLGAFIGGEWWRDPIPLHRIASMFFQEIDLFL